MPISATFTSCCGLGTPLAARSRRPSVSIASSKSSTRQHRYYTVMSPPPQQDEESSSKLSSSSPSSIATPATHLHRRFMTSSYNDCTAPSGSLTVNGGTILMHQPDASNNNNNGNNNKGNVASSSPPQCLLHCHHHHHFLTTASASNQDVGIIADDELSLILLEPRLTTCQNNQKQGSEAAANNNCKNNKGSGESQQINSSDAGGNHHHQSSFSSSSLASFVSSSRCSPARADRQRLVLLPVAASSPSTTTTAAHQHQHRSSRKVIAEPSPLTMNTAAEQKQQQQQQNNNNNDSSLMTTLMMHVYESSPYKKPAYLSVSRGFDSSYSTYGHHQNQDSDEDDRIITTPRRSHLVGSRLAQSSFDLNHLRPSAMTAPLVNPLMAQPVMERLEEPTEQAKKSKTSLWMSWSKRIVQAFHGSSKQQENDDADDLTPKRKPKHNVQNYGTASKATGSNQKKKHQIAQFQDSNVPIYIVEQQQQQQQSMNNSKPRTNLRQAVSVSNCRMGVMDTIPELYEQRCSVISNDFENGGRLAFQPLSPESHVLPQSPYHKADPNQMRSFFKSKSAAAFRDLTATSTGSTASVSTSSVASSASMSPMRHDPVALFFSTANNNNNMQNNNNVLTNNSSSPNQPAVIFRDWSSCAMAAAAAAKRRPNTQPVIMSNNNQQQSQQQMIDQFDSEPHLSGTATLPANFNMASHNHPTASLIALIRAYNVPNAASIASRFVQLAGICSVEQLNQVALYQPNQIRRIVRRVSANTTEQQRLFDMIYDLVNIAGGHSASVQTQTQQTQTQQQIMISENQKNVTNSSTDSGVYGSDGDVPKNEEIQQQNQRNSTEFSALRDYLTRAQIDLASMPYSDKLGFGHIQPDWALALSDVLRCDPISTAMALDKFRLDSLRKFGRIGIPQKELADKVRTNLLARCAAKLPGDPRSLVRPSHNGHNHANHRHYTQQFPPSGASTSIIINSGSASLNRHFNSSKQHTVSQPLLPSIQAAVSSRNVAEMLCDCRSPDCVRL